MNEFAATAVPLLGAVLLAFLWQGALVGLLAWLALALLRHARPQLRYAVACTALLACLALPAAQLARGLAAPAAAGHVQAVVDTPAAVLPSRTATAVLPLPRVPEPLLPWLVAGWAAGVLLLALRMASGLLWVRRLRTRDSRSAGRACQARLDALAARFGLRRPVALRWLAEGDSPLAAGWWRPMVLVPAALVLRLPAPLLEALLAHELAHIRRHDYLVNLLQGMVEILLFYHPVTWWLSRRIRIEREEVADAIAASVLGEPRRLALALSELDRVALPHPLPAHAAHGGQLMSRIRKLLRPAPRATGTAVALPVLALLAASVAFYANAQLKPAGAGTLNISLLSAPATGDAATAATSRTIRVDGARPDTAFALVRDGQDGFSMSGDTDDIDAIRSLRASAGGDFLWFRRGDDAYLVRDPALLARADAAWAPMRPLEAEMKALDARMRPHAQALDALSARMEQLAPPAADEEAMRAAGERMEALAREQAGLAARHAALAVDRAGSADASAQADIVELDARQRDLSQRMERESQALEGAARRMEGRHAPMQALAEEMQAASKPMEAIGAEMEVVGRKIEASAAAAEAALAAIIDEAVEKGLAEPAPGVAAR
jgi:beta-lactamase regulating signal transducer with metallopeptidase domain